MPGKLFLKIKAKVKSGRGALDATSICEALLNVWNDLQDALDGLDED